MRKILAIAAACIALTAGSARAAVIYRDHVATPYSRAEFQAVASGHGFLTELHGAPFGDAAALRAAVLAALPAKTLGRDIRFVTEAGEGMDPRYRLVLVFNGPINVNADDLCTRAADIPTRPLGADERLFVQAAYCRIDSALSDAVGVSSARAATDRDFSRVIEQLALVLFPQRNPNIDPNQNFWPD
jgi:hypothetical protein